MQTVFYNALFQFVCTVGILLSGGFVIAGLNRLFARLLGGSLGNRALFATSFLGTPVHELGHALMCIVFFHKIEEIKLCSFNPANRVFGYVKHSYKRGNLYQSIGNFFIGVAPLFSAGLVVFLLLYLCVPESAAVFSQSAHGAALGATNGLEAFKQTGIAVLETIKSFFAFDNVLNWRWWLFLVIGLSICLHVNLSPSDLRGCLSGLLAFAFAVFAVYLIAGIIGTSSLNSVNKVFLMFNVYAGSLLSLSLFLSVIAVVIAFLTYCIAKPIRDHRERKIPYE